MYLIAVASALAVFFADVTPTNPSCNTDADCTSEHKICAGDSTKACAVDPCSASDACSSNEKCTTNTQVNPPTNTCACKPGYGGTACGDEPECSATNKCTGNFKKCKEEQGKQSVCVFNECGDGCTLPGTGSTGCKPLTDYIKCIEDNNKTRECVTKKDDLSKITAPNACTTLTDTCNCQVHYWATDLTGDNQPCTALNEFSKCLSNATKAKGCNDENKREDLKMNVASTIKAKKCAAGGSHGSGVIVVSSVSGIFLAVLVAVFSI